MNRDVIRLRHRGGQHFIVADGNVYTDLDGDGRINGHDRMPDGPEAPSAQDVLAAARSLADSYDLALSVGAKAPVGDAFSSDGLLNALERSQFHTNGVVAGRTALQRHLDFFDLDTRDGMIGLRENWRAWRRLGYGWLRALVGALGSALVFGRVSAGFAIDIQEIDRKRRKASGLYTQGGDINRAFLDECLAAFRARTDANAGGSQRDRDQDRPPVRVQPLVAEITHSEALDIITTRAAARNHELGSISKRQFKSLFELCARLNHGRKVITVEQFERLFDGSLLYLAASTPASNGRRRNTAADGHLPIVVEIALVVLALACAPWAGSWRTRGVFLGIVSLSWLVAHFVPGRTAVERAVMTAVGILLAGSVVSGPWREWLPVWPVIGLVALIAVNQKESRPLIQFLFFCRFPLLLALTTMALPLVAVFPASKLFRSMLALRFFGVAFVVLLTVLAAEVFVNAASLIAHHVSSRFRNTPAPIPWTAPAHWIDRWWKYLIALIAAPLAVTLVWEAEISRLGAAGAVLAGSAAAVLLNVVLQRIHRREKVQRASGRLRRSVGVRLSGTVDAAGYLDADGALIREHLSNAVFFASTFVLYVAGYFVLRPDGPFQTPAIAFVLFILMMLGLLLPGFSFFADKYRVSTIVALSAVPLVLYFVNDIDHYFEVRVPAVEAGSVTGSDIREAFDARLQRSRQLYAGEEPVIVAVAAGGGGGSAAYWLARVLAGLQHDNGPRFFDSIHVLSTVSGGSVGTLYLIDRLPGNDGIPPEDARWQKVLETAKTSTLEPIAWGLAYPDFWRFFSISFNPILDRGWAFEEAMDRLLEHRGALLSDWRGEMLAGRRPAVLFNATMTEPGDRLVLSPLRLIGPMPGCRDEPLQTTMRQPRCQDQIDARTLESVYGAGADLRVTTAARLSAAFPWVTPIAKARGAHDRERTFHVADGGYYDNNGVVTLVEWSRKAIEFARDKGVKKMLLVDIRVTDAPPKFQGRTGWVYDTLGPILTMLNVRGTNQVSRNRTDVEMLSNLRQADGIRLEYVPFPLTTDTSLSWRLSSADVGTIDAAWTSAGTICRARQAVHDFLSPQERKLCN